MPTTADATAALEAARVMFGPAKVGGVVHRWDDQKLADSPLIQCPSTPRAVLLWPGLVRNPFDVCLFDRPQMRVASPCRAWRWHRTPPVCRGRVKRCVGIDVMHTCTVEMKCFARTHETRLCRPTALNRPTHCFATHPPTIPTTHLLAPRRPPASVARSRSAGGCQVEGDHAQHLQVLQTRGCRARPAGRFANGRQRRRVHQGCGQRAGAGSDVREGEEEEEEEEERPRLQRVCNRSIQHINT